MTSLHELRAIEQQRMADERAAITRAREEEAAAIRAAEQARIAAAAAREQAEREERIRVEQARADAERQARLRIEAVEAAERARLAAQLEQERLAQEIELRRAEVAKQRPTWMVAVTAVALVAGIAFAWFAVDRSRQADAAEQATARAADEMRQAKADAAATIARVGDMERKLGEVDAAVAQAQQALAVATTEIKRKEAQARLDEANRKAKAVRDAVNKANLEEERRVRRQPITVDSCGANNVICPKQGLK